MTCQGHSASECQGGGQWRVGLDSTPGPLAPEPCTRLSVNVNDLEDGPLLWPWWGWVEVRLFLLEKLPIISTLEKCEKWNLSAISQGHVSWFAEFLKRGFTFSFLPGYRRRRKACRTGLCPGSLAPLLKLRCPLKFSLHLSRGVCTCSQSQRAGLDWTGQVVLARLSSM